MKRAILSFVLLVLSWNLAAAQDAASQFIGVWHLVLIERHTPDGDIVPLNRPYSTGQIIYTDTGHFALQFSRPDRLRFSAEEPSAEEGLEAFKDYGARYGTYTLNEAEDLVIHHQQNSLAPFTPESADMIYSYEFSNNHLIWTTAPRVIDDPAHRFNGTEIFQTYSFERAD